MNQSTAKTCSRCQTIYQQPRHAFHTNKNAKDGLTSWCRKCRAEAASKRHQRKMEAREFPRFESLPGEEWRPISNARGYEISNFGRARTWKLNRHRMAPQPKLLRQWKDPLGYRYVTVSVNDKKRTTATHRLVAEAFIGPVAGDDYVCHKNDVKHDNRLVNLYVGDAKSNAQDKARNGGLLRGEDCNRKLTTADVLEIRRLRGCVKQKELAKRFGVHQVTISEIQLRKIWRHV